MKDKDRVSLYRKTRSWIISKIYSHQKDNSIKRGHIQPEYTKEQLSDWMFSRPNFEELYNNRIKSWYKKDLKPSVDRLNNYKWYSLDNIQLITFNENRLNVDNDRKNGKFITIQNKTVIRININTLEEKEYYSLSEASRDTNIISQNISKVCKWKRNHAWWFKWKFKN